MQTTKKITKTTKKRILGFLVILTIAFTAAQVILIQTPREANAGSLWDSQTGIGGSGSDIGGAFGQTGDKPDHDIRIVIAQFVELFLGFLGIIFVILLIMAGYKWMTAGGNEESVKEARSQISRAVIGLIIILVAWSVTIFVTACVLEASGNIPSIWYCPELNNLNTY